MEQSIFPDQSDSAVIHHVINQDELDAVISRIQDESVLGFDIEWPPSFTKGKTNPVSVVQLAGRAHILVVQLRMFDAFPTSLRTILEDEAVLKVGAGIIEDAAKLKNDHMVEIRGMRDLNKEFISVDPEPWMKILPPPSGKRRAGKARRAEDDLVRFECPGLRRLVSRYLGLELPKPHGVRLSDWSAPLTTAQVDYAAYDALAGLFLNDALQRLWEQSNVTGGRE